MPRKDDIKKTYHSSNDRSSSIRAADADSPIESFGSNDIVDAMTSNPAGEWASNGFDLWTGKQNYSNFVKRYNQLTDGWYSTIAGGLPFISNIHNALLGRDSAKDYLKNNNLDWKDMQGYNDVKLLSRVTSSLSGLANQGGTYLQNIGNDLGKLYSGQTSRIKPTNGYSSRMMETW